MLYETSRGINSWEFASNHIWKRITTGSAEAGHTAMTRFGYTGQAGYYLGRDFTYLMQKYSPFAPAQQDLDLPLDKLVSVKVYNTPVSSNAFIVPVTVGAFAELVVNFGDFGALLGMVLIGVSIGAIFSAARNTDSVLACSVYGFALYMLQIYITNGNLAYTVFNTALVAGFLLILYIGSGCLSHFRGSHFTMSTNLRRRARHISNVLGAAKEAL